MRPGPRVASADGTTLSTRLHGPLERPRLLLQHGVGSSCTYLDEAVAPPLVAAGWCVVVADLRGHGASSPVRDPAGHHLDRHVEDVVALVAATGAVAVGGVSLGAHAAVAAVGRGLVEVNRVVAALPAWTGEAVAGEGPHAAVAAEVRAVGLPAVIARLQDEDGLLPWLRRVLVRDFRAADRASLEAALVALDGGRAPAVDEIAAVTHLGVVAWRDDPGHPFAVASAWAEAAGSEVTTLALTDPQQDATALGRAMASALGAP